MGPDWNVHLKWIDSPHCALSIVNECTTIEVTISVATVKSIEREWILLYSAVQQLLYEFMTFVISLQVE